MKKYKLFDAERNKSLATLLMTEERAGRLNDILRKQLSSARWILSASNPLFAIAP